jgi:hypothetical protein
MTAIVRTADSKGRISLPGFANATVILEAISADEYRVRKAATLPGGAPALSEEQMPAPLSERDAKRLVKVLEQPPRPNAAARRAARRIRKPHG